MKKRIFETKLGSKLRNAFAIVAVEALISVKDCFTIKDLVKDIEVHTKKDIIPEMSKVEISNLFDKIDMLTTVVNKIIAPAFPEKVDNIGKWANTFGDSYDDTREDTVANRIQTEENIFSND